MRNRGFVATSLLYSFFLVFLAILLAILQNYTSSSTILYRYNEQVKKHINETTNTLSNVIISKSNNSLIREVGNNELLYDIGNKKETFLFKRNRSGSEFIEYRYIGNDVNNYLCLNSDSDSCSDLWRIIGVFKESASDSYKVKIIKNDNIGSMQYSSINYSNSNNIFANNNYYDRTYTSTLNGKDVYNAERNASSTSKKFSVMYVSDYLYTFAYGVDDDCFNNGSSCINSNLSWLASTDSEWMMLKYNSSTAYIKDSSGQVKTSTANNYVKPVAYLSSNASIKDGDGSVDRPYRLNK